MEDMGTDKILLIVIGAASLIMSITALILTYRQKSRQDNFVSRKTLSDLLSEIVATNIEMGKLREQPASEGVLQLRRVLNTQRRFLSLHADILANEIPSLCYDIDHIVIAGAMEASGELLKADAHWRAGIEKSSLDISRCYNLRGYARFLLNSGQVEEARIAFADALKAASGDDDRSRRERADTRLLWAIAERDYGFGEEAARMIDQAIVEAKRIGQEFSRNDMLKYIDAHWVANLTFKEKEVDPDQ